MSVLSTIRSFLSTRQEHLDDHLVLHALNNQLGNFTQSTTAPSSPAVGDLWLDTDATSVIEHTHSGSSVQVVRKASDTAKTSDAALAADPHLTFDIGASEVWALDFTIYYDGGTTGDIAFDIAFPAGATGKQIFSALTAGTSSDIGSVRMRGGALGWSSLAFGAAGVGTILLAKGHVLVAGGGTAGAVALKWAQAISNGTATTVMADSFLVATRVA